MIPKRGQIELTFNWIYILIAGVVILLFFIGIVVKQKASSEQQLSSDVLRIMESIFTGAGVSEKTKNSIDASSLGEYVFYFQCQEGVGEYGVAGTGNRVQDAIAPLFSPAELPGARLSLWSLPYKLPYKVIDFLFVTSENTKYYLLGEAEFATEFLAETTPDAGVQFRLNVQSITDPELADPGQNFQVRLVDFTNILVQDGLPVPSRLQSLDDTKVTAVAFPSLNRVDYYQKEGMVWKKRTPNPLPIVSLGGLRDAAKYAAIFAGNEEIYTCNMQKAFRRLQYVTEVYAEHKLPELLAYYTILHPDVGAFKPDCPGNLKNYDLNIEAALTSHRNRVAACLLSPSSCAELPDSAAAIKSLNEQLRLNCLTLY